MSQHWNYLNPIPPAGISRTLVKACYQFNGPTSGLVDRSGNGHDLSIVGTNHAWLPMKAEYGCNTILLQGGSDWLISAESPLLGTLGEATLEVVFMKYRLATLDDTYNTVLGIGGDGETEADNVSLAIYGGPTRNWLGVLHEYGAGNNESAGTPSYWQAGISGHLVYIAVTREADGITYHVYVDGEYYEDIILVNPPTGGSNTRVCIGTVANSSNNSFGGAAFNSARWTHAKMLADHIRATYIELRTAA